MKKALAGTLSLILLNMWAIAQQSMSLLVQDEAGNVLPGITVHVRGAGEHPVASTLSDIDGKAELRIASWPARIEIAAVGYESQIAVFDTFPQQTPMLRLKRSMNSLNEVVVTGVGRPTKVDQAVSVYRIVTKEDIRAQGAVTLNDAMRNQLGINIGNDAALGSTVSMRALSGNNVKILVDGLPLNGREAGNLDMSQINLANIERIEMVQGPMSIMYGSDALGGVINLITRNSQKSSTAGAQAFYESIGKYNFGVDGNLVVNRHSLLLNVGRNFFQGWDPDNASKRNPLWRPKETYFGNFKYTWRVNESATLSFAMDLSREHLVMKGSDESFSYLKTTVADQDFYTTRFVNRLIATWKTGASGYWQSNNSFAVYSRERETVITDLTTMNKVPSPNAADHSRVQFNDFNSRSTYNNIVGKISYTVGYDASLSIAKGVDKIEGGQKTIGDYALFLATDLKPLPQITIQPALRATYNTVYDAPLVPSLAFLFKPSKTLSLRGSYARGFRAPSVKELYLNFKDNNHDINGNPDLKAEYGHHFQVSAGYNLLQQGSNNITTSLTGFYDNIHNQIMLSRMVIGGDPLETPPYMYTNLGHTRFLAMQWRNDMQFGNLSLVAGLSYNKSIRTVTLAGSDTGTYITPDFHYVDANAQVNYFLPEWKAGLSIFYKYTGSQPMLNSDITGASIFGDKANAYHNIDMSVDKRLWNDRIMITAGVRNLLNNVILNTPGASGGGTHGGGSSLGGVALTTGRSFFTTLKLQLN